MQNPGTVGTRRSRVLVSPRPDAAAMEERVDGALLKEILGEPLDRRELLIVQWVGNGGGCATCAGGDTGVSGRYV